MVNAPADNQQVIELEAIRLVLSALVLSVLAVVLMQFPDGYDLGFGLAVIAFLVLCFAWLKARYRTRVARTQAESRGKNRYVWDDPTRCRRSDRCSSRDLRKKRGEAVRYGRRSRR
ncbi:hypothetical protein ACLI4R_01735 [Natrialbaceae archaeon A-chndr2]